MNLEPLQNDNVALLHLWQPLHISLLEAVDRDILYPRIKSRLIDNMKGVVQLCSRLSYAWEPPH